MFIYLDQNVLGDLYDKEYHLVKNGGNEWVYSPEHLNEIHRGGRTEILDVLRGLNARLIFCPTSDAGLINDNLKVSVYEEPHTVYTRYLEHRNSSLIDTSIFNPILAAFFGNQEDDTLSSYADDLSRLATDLIHRYPQLKSLSSIDYEKGLYDAGTKTQAGLSNVISLDQRRKIFHLDKGRGSSYIRSENPILDLWKHMNEAVEPTISIDQFFGFDPIDKNLFGYDEWPLFLGVCTCYFALNMIGYRPDEGLPKVSRVPANSSDAMHVAYGAFCSGFITRDKKMCDKAKAIYTYKNIKCEAVHVNDYLSSFGL